LAMQPQKLQSAVGKKRELRKRPLEIKLNPKDQAAKPKTSRHKKAANQ